MSGSVVTRLAQTAARHGARPMLTVGRGTWTYDEVWQVARCLSAAIGAAQPAGGLIGVFCDRDETAYQSILAILASGNGFVPLNPKLPDERLRHIVTVADLSTVIVGKGVEGRVLDVFEGFSGTLICLGASPETSTGASFRIVPRDALADLAPAAPVEPASLADPAYLLFTSGSTGTPKGVPVSHANLAAYVDYIDRLYGYGPEDVHSQTFELTFDLSVHDMMCAWTTGGRLVRFAGAELLSPANIIRKQGVTCWFSVPSLGSIMLRTGGLKPDSLPSLRVSLFCGEALPASLAAQWSEAAPNSIVENLYGPTEATIAFTRYRWEPSASPAESSYGLVPIGAAFDGQTTLVVDEEGRPLQRPCKGQLLLGGSQVTGRYWKADEITREKYVAVAGQRGDRWYVTGDLVEEDAGGCLHFVGRLDSQIKFRGYRIELLEVENAVRKAAGTDLAVAVAWPRDGQEIKDLTAVIEGEDRDVGPIAEAMRALLPEYMVPRNIRFFDALPRNLSGKIDRNAVVARLSAS